MQTGNQITNSQVCRLATTAEARSVANAEDHLATIRYMRTEALEWFVQVKIQIPWYQRFEAVWFMHKPDMVDTITAKEAEE